MTDESVTSTLSLNGEDLIRLSDLIVPEACQSMTEVRAGVDELDRILVTLLARRQRFMMAAARIKPEFHQVRDKARIEDVVQKVLTEARAKGLSPTIAEPVWRELIERCIAFEGETWARLRS